MFLLITNSKRIIPVEDVSPLLAGVVVLSALTVSSEVTSEGKS